MANPTAYPLHFRLTGAEADPRALARASDPATRVGDMTARALFVIYHVVGVKVGCSKEFERRCEQNRATYGADIEIRILEELAGDEIQAAAREAHWARELGYRLGTPYDEAIQNQRDRARASVNSPRHNMNDPEHQARCVAAMHKVTNARIPCRHCGKVGQARAMLRWHFDNCKQRKVAA